MRIAGKLVLTAVLGLTGAVFGSPAAAEIKVGITLSMTGPAAALGVPAGEAVLVLPNEIGGEKVRWILLDDGTSATQSVANARKLITEENVDVLVGSSVAPPSLPLVELAAEAGIPLIATAPAREIIEPMDDKRRWVFKVVPNDSIMAERLADYIVKTGAKRIGFIGFNDSYGQDWYKAAKAAFEKRGMEIVANESYARTDTSVTGQVLKLIAAKPDAILVGASGTPAVLPQKTLRSRGYDKPIYQSHGIATPAFIRLGGKDVEGTVFPAGPFLVHNQLAADDPIRKAAEPFVKVFTDRYGRPPIMFGAHTWDVGVILQHAVPEALKAGRPGTPEFRKALRDAIEASTDLPLVAGPASYSPTEHNGYDQRAAAIVQIKDGKFTLLER